MKLIKTRSKERFSVNNLKEHYLTSLLFQLNIFISFEHGEIFESDFLENIVKNIKFSLHSNQIKEDKNQNPIVIKATKDALLLKISSENAGFLTSFCTFISSDHYDSVEVK